MASNLLAYFWSTSKTESKVHTNPIPVGGAQFGAETLTVATPTSDRAPTWELPTELWIAILENVPRGSLAQVMLVSRSLSEVAEGILYRSVTLKANSLEVLKFQDSIATCPRRTPLVIDIRILRIDGMEDRRVPSVLPKLLAALPNLRSVTLKSSIPNIMPCNSICDVRIPHLRSFTANVRIDSPSAFFDFLAAHPELDALDLGFTYPPDVSPEDDRLAARPFSSLRVLACSSRFLNSRRPVLASLTHLHRTSYLASEVAHIAALVGPQLVSLRLGGRLAMGSTSMGAGRTELRWALGDVAARFPRLRFLQVDSPYKERPYLDTSVVDWLCPRRAVRDLPDEAVSAQRMTIVWMYVEGFWSDAAWARTYDTFLEDAALKCLREWGGYVERVVYEGSIKPYYMESVTLKPGINGGEESLMKARDTGIGDDYWKCA